jgi:hypothetical protein
LQATFQHRTNHGIFFTANYVWAHSLDNAPFDGGADGPIPQNPLDRNADYSDSDNDIRSRLTTYATYELPIGAGRAFLNGQSFASSYLLNGWQVNGIVIAQSGLPFTVTISGTPTNTGASSSRANIVPNVAQYPAGKKVTQWFNTAAFVAPIAYNWGNAGRNSLRGPRETDFDGSLEKDTNLGEARELQLRIELFNALNHPQFNVPAATINSGGAGTITSTSNTARQLQAELRFTF